MDLTALDSILYGLVSGLAEFLPISAQAHRILMQKMLGIEGNVSLLNLFVHLGALAALLVACRAMLAKIRRERGYASLPKRRRKRLPDSQVLLDVRLVKSAFPPILGAILLYTLFGGITENLPVVAALLVVNGGILLLPVFLPSGNKDSRSMSRMDAVLLGLGGLFSVFPGISLVGVTTSIAQMRGAKKLHALSWSLLLSIPVLLCLAAGDLYGLISAGAGGVELATVFFCLLAAAAAYLGAYAALSVMRFLGEKAGFSGFAYYSAGAGLFAFILYMVT